MNPLKKELINSCKETIARCRRALAYGDEVEKSVKRIEEAQSQIDILEGGEAMVSKIKEYVTD